MNDLISINNVRGYLDKNGTAHLNLEDVSRGLGFTTVAKSGNDYVRWNRVNEYLSEFGFATSGKNEFIPENIFYKLCFKASNETARKFQDTVTDEVLPSIRKHGAYITDNTLDNMLSNPDFAIRLFSELKQEREEKKKLESVIEEQKPKVVFADAVSASNTSILVGDMAKILQQNGVNISPNKLFEKLREEGYLCKEGLRHNKPTEYSIKLKIMEYNETAITRSSGDIFTRFTPKITGKGQRYFVEYFLKEDNA